MNPAWHYTYLLLNLGSILFPFAFSFDKRVAFYKNWWRLFPGMIAGASIFILWDQWFTANGIWHFNPEYILGIYIGKLPLEEWMFFFFIPYACMFIYESLRTYLGKWILSIPQYLFKVIAGVLLVSFALIAMIYHTRIYTLITFTGCAIMLLLFLLIFRMRHFPLFLFMWIVHLVPLFLVNGVLTGLPVVMYNDSENMGLRIGTVPLEDSFYSMFLLLINITVYEWLGEWKIKRKAAVSVKE